MSFGDDRNAYSSGMGMPLWTSDWRTVDHEMTLADGIREIAALNPDGIGFSTVGSPKQPRRCMSHLKSGQAPSLSTLMRAEPTISRLGRIGVSSTKNLQRS